MRLALLIIRDHPGGYKTAPREKNLNVPRVSACKDHLVVLFHGDGHGQRQKSLESSCDVRFRLGHEHVRTGVLKIGESFLGVPQGDSIPFRVLKGTPILGNTHGIHTSASTSGTHRKHVSP